MTRGARTHRLKNLDLYLDLSKERVVRHVESWIGKDGGPGGRGRTRSEMANAYGRSPEVRECKFYDQSGGLIRRRCAVLVVGGRKRRSFVENTRIDETPMTLPLESTNLRGVVIQKLLTILEDVFC